jgi:hypothetical protein
VRSVGVRLYLKIGAKWIKIEIDRCNFKKFKNEAQQTILNPTATIFTHRIASFTKNNRSINPFIDPFIEIN